MDPRIFSIAQNQPGKFDENFEPAHLAPMDVLQIDA